MSTLRVTSGDDYGLDGANDRRLTVAVTKGGTAVDLTDTDLTFMVKRSPTDADADALISKTPTLATQSGDTLGVAYIALAAADTADLAGIFPWELSAVDAVGTITLARGSIRIVPDLIVGS